jgi:hypothetical protein
VHPAVYVKKQPMEFIVVRDSIQTTALAINPNALGASGNAKLDRGGATAMAESSIHLAREHVDASLVPMLGIYTGADHFWLATN